MYRKIIGVSALGGALEFYDFSIFMLFSKILSDVFFKNSSFMTLLATYMIFASGYFVRPIGGIILAHFGDRYGRKKIFTLTIMLMAAATLLMGLLPTYAQAGIIAPLLLLTLRVVQGLAVGGEIPGAVTFVYEHIDKKIQCTGNAILFFGLNCGILLGALVGALILNNISTLALDSYGWRIPFILGGILGFIGMYIRYKLKETPVFEAILAKGQTVKIPIFDVFKKNKKHTLIGTCLVITNATLVVLFYMYMPSFLVHMYHCPLSTAFNYNSIGLLLCVTSNIIWGVVADRFRDKINRCFILSSAIIILISIPFFLILAHHSLLYMIIFYILLAAGFGGINSIFTVILADMFPPTIRFTGISAAYNIGFALAGGLTPILSAILVQNFSPISPAYLAISVCILGIICIIWNYRVTPTLSYLKHSNV